MIYKVFFYLKQTEVRQGAQDTNSFRLQKNSECSNELVMNDTNIWVAFLELVLSKAQ